MIKVLNSNLKMIGVLNNIHECTEHQVLNSEYTLDFSCTAEKLKTELLYDKTSIIECDDNYYKVFKFYELHETGGLVTFSCIAEHIGYEIIQKIFEDGFEMTGTVQEIGQAACAGTRFTFTSDIVGEFTVKLSGVTNARAVIDRLCLLTWGEVKWNKFNIELKQSIGQNIIYVEFGKNCSSIKRHVQYEPDKVSYTVDLIDCNDEETKELRKVHLGDTIIINDKMLHTQNVSKKVISLDIDKLANSANSITDQAVESFDRTIPSSTVCVIGDKGTTIIDEILKNVEIPDIDPNILIEVVEQKVITTEVAMIQNCWINELSVNYLETNFNALDTRQPYPTGGVRNFFRIYDEVHEHITQELSETEVEDYKTPSGLQIYWTAINDEPQAYKYFTITHPKEYNPDLTDAEVAAFKVKVRKVVKEYVKLSSNFETFTGTNDVVPTMIFGSGHGDSLGNPISAPSDCQIINGRTIYRGQGMIYKSRQGMHINYINADGKKYEVVVGENGISIDGMTVTKISFYNDGFGFNKEEYFQFVTGGIKRLSDNSVIATESINASVLTAVGGVS